jgi:hypothetical protein
MKKLWVLFLILTLAGAGFAESYLYIEQSKEINGDFKYYLPKIELNKDKYAGNFFGNKCLYISEFEGGLVYSAKRSNWSALNHHSITAEWNLGVELGPVFATYSLGADYYIAGNSDGIPEGLEGRNTARLGIAFK